MILEIDDLTHRASMTLRKDWTVKKGQYGVPRNGKFHLHDSHTTVEDLDLIKDIVEFTGRRYISNNVMVEVKPDLTQVYLPNQIFAKATESEILAAQENSNLNLFSVGYSDSMGGYFCYAKAHIPPNVIVAEYCGYFREASINYSTGKSMLQDISVGIQFKDKTLILSPAKYANEGFLFSGASAQMRKHDQALKSVDNKQITMRMEVRVILNRPRLFLVTSRSVLKDEILYWDYLATDKQDENYNYFKFAKDVKGAIILNSKRKFSLIPTQIPIEFKESFVQVSNSMVRCVICQTEVAKTKSKMQRHITQQFHLGSAMIKNFNNSLETQRQLPAET